MPFTEWPYGGSQNLGVTRPGNADSPLMVAIAQTGIGRWMNDSHLQLYGWVNAGFNVSSNSRRPGGNAPIGYAYTPNTLQLDQAVLYLERVPDTVQDDHVDWGFRISALYGETYRYTTAYGLASYQLLKKNNVNGYDFPMAYLELFVPQLAEGGVNIRIGRFISIPDIEAQLAPNNYMYTHSLSYTFDNFTNEGIQTTIGVTKNFFVQLGLTDGTESATTAELRQTFRLSDRENHRDRNRRYPNRFCHGGSPGSPVLTSTSATDNFLNPSQKFLTDKQH